MTIKISTLARNIAGAAIVSLVDQGSTRSSGLLEIRSGTRPASPQAPAFGTILASVSLAIPAFREFANGIARANAIAGPVIILNTGTATWFRVYDRNNQAVFDGDVSKDGTPGDLVFDYVNFVAGGVVNINNLFATMPE